MSGLRLYLLGGFEVREGEVPLIGFKTNKARALLAYLAMEGRRPQHREKLVGLLWLGYLWA